jgi:hypothetical protein
MGTHENIGHDKFPQQGYALGKKVKVCYGYDTSKTTYGEIVRDDSEAPYRTIIKLYDGRYILGTECQFSEVEHKLPAEIVENIWFEGDDMHVTTKSGKYTIYKNAKEIGYDINMTGKGVKVEKQTLNFTYVPVQHED